MHKMTFFEKFILFKIHQQPKIYHRHVLKFIFFNENYDFVIFTEFNLIISVYQHRFQNHGNTYGWADNNNSG